MGSSKVIISYAVLMEDVQLKFGWPNNGVFVSFCGAVLHFVEPGLRDKTVVLLAMRLEEAVVVDHSLHDCSQLLVCLRFWL